MTDPKERLLKGSVIAFIGFALGGVFSYILRIILARNLSLEQIGLFSAVLSLIIMVTLFQRIGTESALVRYIGVWKEQGNYTKMYAGIKGTVICQLLVGIVFALCLYLLSPWLSTHYFKDPQAAMLVVGMSALLFLLVLEDTPRRVFQGFGNMTWFSLLEAGKVFLLLILVLVGFLFSVSIWIPVLSYLLSSLIIGLVGSYGVIRSYPLIFKNRTAVPGTFKEVFCYGLPLLFLVIGNKAIETLDLLMLTYFSTLDQVGIYSVVLPTAAITLFCFRPVAVVIMSVAIELWEKNLKSQLLDLTNLVHKYLTLIMIPVVLIMALNAKFILTTLFGASYGPGAVALQLILSCILFYGLAFINISLLMSIGASKKAGKVMIYATLFNFVVNFTLIPPFGMHGAAISTALSYLLTFILSKYYFNQNFNSTIPTVKLPLKRIISLLLVSFGTITVIVTYFSHLVPSDWKGAIISAVVFSLVYIVTVFLLRLSNIQEIKNLYHLMLKK